MRRIADRGPAFYQFEQWPEDNGLVHGIFTRRGGVSVAPWESLNVGSTVGDDPQAVQRNRELMYATLGVDGSRVCTVWQVHSAETVIVTDPMKDGQGWLAQADGMVTDRPHLALVMRFADCVPVLFYDPVKQVIGMAHAGWRGTVLGAAVNVARTMIDSFACRPQDIQAGIGPSIGPGRYQVGADVVAAFREAFGDLEGLVRRADDDSVFYLDLWEANRRALQALGIAQVEVAGICTASHTDDFFSHRAEQGQTGRFGAVMALRGR